ncbi:MAG: hypothetical protein ACXWO3_08350, partial [Isosphaeraceae bacterium]
AVLEFGQAIYGTFVQIFVGANSANLNKSQHFTSHLFRPWRRGSARGSDDGPRRFTAVVPTPHAYSGQ